MSSTQTNRKVRHLTTTTVALLGIAGSLGSTPSYAAGWSFSDLFSQWKLYRASGDARTEVYAEPGIRSLLASSSVHTLSVKQHVASPDLETTKFQHYYKGLEVVGSMGFHHKGRKGTKVVDHLARFDLDTSPSLSETQAISVARGLVGDRQLTAKPELKILPRGDGSAKLVYWVNIRPRGHDGGREVIVDAHSGKVIANLSKDLTIAPVQVMNAQGQGLDIEPQLVDDGSGQPTLDSCVVKDLASGRQQQISGDECQNLSPDQLPQGVCQVVMQGAPIMVAASKCQPGNDDVAQNATSNATKVLTYYLDHHKRDGYDDQGSPVISVVHAGVNYANAHWDTDQNIMVYGDGDPKLGLGNFTLALDVAGHEMTHGVTAHTAQLLGMGQSGALNEAYSDFFGIMIANGGTDWTIGKALFLDKSKATGVRDLANPANVKLQVPTQDGDTRSIPFPSKISQAFPTRGQCDDSNDNCWVHENATIPGHASYLVTQAIGAEKAEHLYYVTLTQALSAQDTIRSAAKTTQSVCDQIYDEDTCGKVKAAFAQVGL